MSLTVTLTRLLELTQTIEPLVKKYFKRSDQTVAFTAILNCDDYYYSMQFQL